MKNTKDTIDGHMSEHGMQFMAIALAHVMFGYECGITWDKPEMIPAEKL